MHKMKRAHYADMFGPTTGDKVMSEGNSFASGKVSAAGKKAALKRVKAKKFNVS